MQRHGRKRTLLTITAIVAVIGLLTAGLVALTSGRSGDSAVTAVQCQPARLATCLIKAPAGAVRLSSVSPWFQQTSPNADLYASTITADAPGIAADTASELGADSLRDIVHTGWNAVDGNNVDLVLLAFGTQKGAQDWNAARTGEILAAYPGPAVAVPGDPVAKAHAATMADAEGNFVAAYSTALGDLVLNVAYSSPTRFSAGDLETWAGTELASLRTAPPAAADPADAAPGTEQRACGGGLGWCLMPVPSGGEPWTSPNDKLWVASATPTVKQYVQYGWDGKPADIPTVLGHFNADGATNIAHEDWTLNNGDQQADVYLVQTITAAGAAQLASTNFGEPDWGTSGLGGNVHTIPNEPGASAWYTNKADSGGFVTFYFTEVIGNVIVEGWCFFYGSFDSATADSWAQSQLDRVSRGASPQPMGLFPLGAPALPAAGQGACPASGDCLMPLPGGATDTTGSSFQSGESLGADSYASQYETATSADIATWLKSDGFKGAGHRSWTTGGGATADAVLLKYGTAAEAKAAATLEYGVNAFDGRVCTDSAVPDSLCLAAPVGVSDFLQKETIRVIAWKGDYEVSISVTQSDDADLADAYTWVQQQLNMLPAS